MGIGMAPALDTKRTSGLTPREGSLSNSPPHESNGYYISVLDYITKVVALRVVSTSGQLEDLFAHAQVKIDPL